MSLYEYTWCVSTFKPPALGDVELAILDFFGNAQSFNVYSIYKQLKRDHFSQSISYKNIHKRVKRLLKLKLIESVAGSFPKGAKHYRINAYGLINLRSSSQTENHRFILLNKDNIVIQALLEFLDENTLDSFYLLKEFPTRDISEYISDCCTLTCTYCKNIWKKIDDHNLDDILPPEITIQKYMSFLDGKPVDQGVLEEIEQYRERLRKKCKNGDTLLSKMDSLPLLSTMPA